MLSSTIQQLRNAQITLTRSYFDLEVTRAIVHSDLKEMLFVELAHFCFVSCKQLRKAMQVGNKNDNLLRSDISICDTLELV